MEHVLRQSLIALRLAERIGVDEQGRVAVYYTALLTNVGCHSDAHEQAKWFGDDIGLKADKYVYGLHGAQGALATARRFGSGAGMSHRFRLGLEFAVSGHHDLDAMIAHHSEMARRLGEDLGLTPDTLAALDASYEQWDGNGWPGELRGDDVPIAARLARDRRVRRGGSPREAGSKARGRCCGRGAARSSTPTSPTRSRRTRTCCWPSSTRSMPGTPSSGPSPRSPCCSPTSSSTRPCSRSRTSWTSSRRTPWGTPGRWPTWPPRPRRGWGCPRARSARCGGPDWCTASASWASPTRSSTSRAP